jgi:hypothetical protein
VNVPFNSSVTVEVRTACSGGALLASTVIDPLFVCGG